MQVSDIAPRVVLFVRKAHPLHLVKQSVRRMANIELSVHDFITGLNSDCEIQHGLQHMWSPVRPLHRSLSGKVSCAYNAQFSRENFSVTEPVYQDALDPSKTARWMPFRQAIVPGIGGVSIEN